MTPARWRIAAASCIGTSHIKQGVACQDSHACRLVFAQPDEEVAVLVASDGAGSASRADDGSRSACATIVERAGDYVTNGGRIDDLTQKEARDWIAQVRNEIKSLAEAQNATLRDYACTLLVAVVGQESAAFLQIGDGAMVAKNETGEWSWIHWPQRGDYANSTFFVTESDAEERLVFDLVRRPIDEISVFTDGLEPLVLHYATRTAHAPFFEAMFGPVRASSRVGVDVDLSGKLERYLDTPIVCERTDDDKTLILATRRRHAPALWDA